MQYEEGCVKCSCGHSDCGWCMLPITMFKLEETEFFLYRMQKAIGRESVFKFYFSAFISAAIGSLHALEAEYKRIQRKAKKERQCIPQDKYIAQIQELKNNVLIREVRDLAHHGKKLLPLTRNPQNNGPIKKIGEGYTTIQVKVFNRLTDSPYSFSFSTVCGSDVMLHISKNVQLSLPEMKLIGDQEEIKNYEVERELHWTINIDNTNANDCINSCESYFASIKLLTSKIVGDLNFVRTESNI